MDSTDAELYNQVLEGLGIAAVVFGTDGRIQSANGPARSVVESMGDDTWYTGLYDPRHRLLDEVGQPLPVDQFPAARTLSTGKPQPTTVRGMRSPHGAVTWFLIGTVPMRDGDGTLTGAICTFVDITKRLAAQDAERASEERFRLLAENAADLVYRARIQPEPYFEYVNPAVRTMLGYEPEELYGGIDAVLAIVHAEDRDRAAAMVENPLRAAEPIQLRVVARNGEVVWTEHRIVPVLDVDGTVVAVEGIGRDVTALKVKEAFLNHRALHDPLTGLGNRVLLLDLIEREIARSRREPAGLAVLYVDIDRFKTVNDNLGHAVGDQLLTVVARRIEAAVRPYDRVARLGGDEFGAILSELADPDEAESIAERVRVAVGESVDIGEGTLMATVSIGVATSCEGVTSAGELLRRADVAMYAAKDRGRDRVERYETLTADGDPGAVR